MYAVKCISCLSSSFADLSLSFGFPFQIVFQGHLKKLTGLLRTDSAICGEFVYGLFDSFLFAEILAVCIVCPVDCIIQ